MKITEKIVTSVTPPQLINVAWHNPETGELKMFGNKGWEVVGGKPGDDSGDSDSNAGNAECSGICGGYPVSTFSSSEVILVPNYYHKINGTNIKGKITLFTPPSLELLKSRIEELMMIQYLSITIQNLELVEDSYVFPISSLHLEDPEEILSALTDIYQPIYGWNALSLLMGCALYVKCYIDAPDSPEILNDTFYMLVEMQSGLIYGMSTQNFIKEKCDCYFIVPDNVIPINNYKKASIIIPVGTGVYSGVMGLSDIKLISNSDKTLYQGTCCMTMYTTGHMSPYFSADSLSIGGRITMYGLGLLEENMIITSNPITFSKSNTTKEFIIDGCFLSLTIDSPVSWTNDNPPTFDGITRHVISILDGVGCYTVTSIEETT